MGRNADDVSAQEREAPSEPSHAYHDSASSSRDSIDQRLRVDDEEQANRIYTRYTPTSSESRLVRAIARRVPGPVVRIWRTVAAWVQGPVPARAWKITPLVPKIQHAPLHLLERIAPRLVHRFWILVSFYFVFLLLFITLLRESAFSAEIPEYGAPLLLGCTDSYWSDKNGCGLDGSDCRPFQNTTLAFRCPANCVKAQQLNPHAVGAQEVIYQPLVVGGPTDLGGGDTTIASAFYRGDSFICAAAIHSGFITDAEGGCGVLSLIGNRNNFPSVSLNGISSVGFDSDFPLSFKFLPSTKGDCKDLRWPLLAVSVTLSALLSIFTTSAPVFFWSVFCGLFFHCALVSDPPTASNYYTLVSTAFGRFLPAAFCAAIMYIYFIRRTLSGLTAQFEKTILWLGGCWVGVLNNNTFDKIPIQRLTPHDLKQQPGAISALIIIVLVLVVIAIGQAWAIRIEGKLPQYLALYCFMGFCLGMLAAIPDMNLRIHHYILALLLIPGTALQTRPSLLYQGILLGLFINGIARWGFDSIVQTPAQLLGDGQIGSSLPTIVGPTIGGSTISFGWPQFNSSDGDGISILVNDVERFRHYVYDGAQNFTWTRQAPEGDPEYFRFGFMDGSTAQDYTRAGIWAANGAWTEPAEGASKA